jgi:D-alanyl-D-alanine carboxypeptidase (penicillin-binding protein 5/6)
MKKNHTNINKDVLRVVGFFLFLVVLFLNLPAKVPSTTSGSAIENKLNLHAAAAYVLDENSGDILYSKNETEVYEIASITKLMTALVALEEMSGETVIIDRDSYISVGDTGLLIDEKWQLENLVAFMLVNSSNDAAEAIAKSYPRGREKFIERMNDRAKELGFNSLVFKNPTGLNETDEFGGRGNAVDVVNLLSFVYQKFPKALEGTELSLFSIDSKDTNHVAENTNLVASAVFGLQAGKTGYTDKAGGSYVFRVNVGPSNPVIAVVLGTKTREDRFVDTKAITSYISKEFAKKP